jgi:hypothetical protein
MHADAACEQKKKDSALEKLVRLTFFLNNTTLKINYLVGIKY